MEGPNLVSGQTLLLGREREGELRGRSLKGSRVHPQGSRMHRVFWAPLGAVCYHRDHPINRALWPHCSLSSSIRKSTDRHCGLGPLACAVRPAQGGSVVLVHRCPDGVPCVAGRPGQQLWSSPAPLSQRSACFPSGESPLLLCRLEEGPREQLRPFAGQGKVVPVFFLPN